MSSVPGERARVAASRVASLTDADRALLLAVRAWGDGCRRPDDRGEPAGTVRELIANFRDWLAPDWFQRLCDAVDDLARPGEGEPPGELADPARSEPRAAGSGSSDPRQALAVLRRMLAESTRVELGRVHSSWWVRALQEESPTVQRLVAASVPGLVRDQLQAGLLLDSQDLVSERTAAPEVASWVMSLWTERLVGGESERADDPPAIIVLGRLSPRAGYRLCRLAGLCKYILAAQNPVGHPSASDRARWEWLKGRLATADQDLQALARRDVEMSGSSRLPPRRHAARLGLATLARLLADSEAFRLRWALQHWPYPVAKLIRSLMPPTASRPASLLEWESLVLKTAWDRLNLEGRLALPWPQFPGKGSHGT
jgi:hypothetical protein